MPHSKRIPILILDGYWFHTLRTVRALSMSDNWELHVISPKKRLEAPIHLSRHLKSFFNSQASEEDPEWLDAIIERAKAVKAQVIFPLKEVSSLFCIQNREKLEQYARLTPLPDEETFRIAIDKGRLASFMEQHGISHPRSILFTVGEDSVDVLHQLTFPLILKPRRGEFGKGINVVDDKDQLQQKLDLYKPGTLLIAQEFIDGEDIDCSFLSLNGQILGWTIQRSLEAPHADFSAANDIEFINDNPTRDLAFPLAKALRYTGIAHLDMRKSKVDGKVHVLEINARIWGSLMGSIAAGVNVPENACRLALGIDCEPSTQQEMRFSNRGCGIGHTIRHLLRSKQATFRPGETHFPYFIRDPLPDLVQRLSKTYKA